MKHRNRRRAFTLIEVLVVIGVIVLLVGLLVAVIPAVTGQSELRETENTLRLLDAALEEWTLSRDGEVTWGTDDQPAGSRYDLQIGTPHVFAITELFGKIGRNEAVQEILARIRPDSLPRYDSSTGGPPTWLTAPLDPDPNAGAATGQYGSGDWDGGLTVLDAWGQPIRVIHPGPTWDFSFGGTPDPDGTVRTVNENIYGIALNRKVCFVSAGPDSRFGNLSGDATAVSLAADNVYTYEVINP
ncbi:MAG: prepilin-type N-terminal cleavage/methylation domain-containing protein [Planctomycetota bacterium]|jgi:prepilin-type N-terminal cleavage/methylation domain-containing protein